LLLMLLVYHIAAARLTGRQLRGIHRTDDVTVTSSLHHYHDQCSHSLLLLLMMMMMMMMISKCL